MIQLAVTVCLTSDVAEVLGHARVSITGDERAVAAEPLGDSSGMAAGAKRGVEGCLAGRGLQKIEELLNQHGGVCERHLVLTKVQARLR